MLDYTFFTHPMSRGQIARWALHEAGAAYEQVIVDWGRKPQALLAANPMGKVPTIVHHTADGARSLSEAAAICAYLAEMHPETELLPHRDEVADYYRWMFFTAGPLEQAITSRALGFEPGPEQEAMVGWGSFERAVSTLERHLAARPFVCGERFTMADVYVGSAIDWGLSFGTLPSKDAFVDYAERLRARPQYKAAKAVDNELIEEMRK